MNVNSQIHLLKLLQYTKGDIFSRAQYWPSFAPIEMNESYFTGLTGNRVSPVEHSFENPTPGVFYITLVSSNCTQSRSGISKSSPSHKFSADLLVQSFSVMFIFSWVDWPGDFSFSLALTQCLARPISYQDIIDQHFRCWIWPHCCLFRLRFLAPKEIVFVLSLYPVSLVFSCRSHFLYRYHQAVRVLTKKSLFAELYHSHI